MTQGRWTLGIVVLIAVTAVGVAISLGLRQPSNATAAAPAESLRRAGALPPAPAAASPAPLDAQVTFRVTVPSNTPVHAKIFLSGDVPELGTWSPAGLQMTRDADGTYVASASLPRGRPVEFKLTRGTWETVETKADGGAASLTSPQGPSGA